MSEIELMRQIQLRASELGHRLFRNNSGVGWAGEQVRVGKPTMVMMREGDVLIRNARALHAGLAPGSSDLIGITCGPVLPGMVGMNIGIFTAVEVKAMKKNPTDTQESFIDMVKRLGGIGIVAKTVEDYNVPRIMSDD